LDESAQTGPSVTVNTITFVTQKDTDTDFLIVLTEVSHVVYVAPVQIGPIHVAPVPCPALSALPYRRGVAVV
jgi:hypothetical protein